MFTNTMRMTGLSGIDTDLMVRQIMRAESMRYDALKKKNVLLEWKQEAYRGVALSLRTFQDTYLSLTAANSLRMPSTFNVFNAKALVGTAETALVSVNAGSGAKVGSYNLEVISTARSDLYKSAAFGSDTLTAEFDLSVFDNPAESAVFSSSSLTLDVNGVKRTIYIGDIAGRHLSGAPTPTDVENFKNELQTALNAANAFGPGIFTVDADDLIANGQLKFTMKQGYDVTVSGATGNALDVLGLSVGQGTKTDLRDINFADLIGHSFAPGVTSASIVINNTTITFSDTDTADKVIKEINASAAGVKMSYDPVSRAFSLESVKTGYANRIEFGTDAVNNSFFIFINGDPGAYRMAEDAVVRIDGAQVFRSETNAVSTDLGFIVTVTEAAKNEPNITINVTRNVTQTFDVIKGFIEGYNKLIEELNSLESTNRPRSGKYSYYEPLTEEEKQAMSEREVELWEVKAKTGLLYRDPLLKEITDSMRKWLYEPVELKDGTRLRLVDIGITTTNRFQDRGRLEINEERLRAFIEERGDDLMALFTQSAMESTASNPDGVQYSSVMGRPSDRRLSAGGLAERINDLINGAVDGTGGFLAKQAGIKGATTEVNNALFRQINANNVRLDEMLKVLAKREDHYYSMFARMEAALMQSNSQMQYLMSMMGQQA